jgi:uncharacterized protein
VSTDRKVAIVTGASAGIGLETALAFARRGYAVTLAARRVDRMEAVAEQCRQAGGEALVIPTDVAHGEQVRDMVARTVGQFGRLDVMVNNAGYGVFGEIVDLVEQDLRDIMEVNFFGLWHGTVAAAKVMMAQGSGHIFNVSSVIGKRGTPMHGAYCTTKFAVCGLTESARVELRPHGVWVTLVCPGMTETEFFDKGSMARRARSSFNKYSHLMPPRVVGEAIARRAGRYKTEMVFSLGGKVLTLIAAILPRAADAMMEMYRRDLLASIRGDKT